MMMKLTRFVQLATTVTLILLGQAAAFSFELNHHPLVSQRIDLIVKPHSLAGHDHNFAGGAAMVLGQDPSKMCTTADVKADKSLYWAPGLYHYDDHTKVTANTRTSRNSRKSADKAQGSMAPPPVAATTTLIISATRQPCEAAARLTAAELKKQPHCVKLSCPPMAQPLSGAVNRAKIVSAIEAYLRQHVQGKVFDDLVCTFQIDKTTVFSKPLVIKDKQQFDLLLDAAAERPSYPITVHATWQSDPPTVLEVDSTTVDAPIPTSQSPAKTSAKKQKERTATHQSQDDDYGEVEGEREILGRIVSNLQRRHGNCDDCSKKRHKGMLCWVIGQQHHEITHYLTLKWAREIAAGPGIYEHPPPVVMNSLQDVAPSPRGIHAKTSNASMQSAVSSWAASQSGVIDPDLSASLAGSQGSISSISMAPSPGPPTVLGARAFQDISNTCGSPSSPAASTTVAKAKRNKEWTVIGFARRLGGHAKIRLARKLSGFGLDEMVYLAKAQQRGTLERLDLDEVERVIIDCWLEAWPEVQEDESLASREFAKTWTNEETRLSKHRRKHPPVASPAPEEAPFDPLDSQSTYSSPQHPS